jgi:putative ABC transport system permease protein
MTESLRLALGGGALGLVLALFLARFYLAAFFERTAGKLMHYDARPEFLVVAATLAVCIAAAFLSGLVPALTSIREGATPALSRQPCPTPRHTRLTRALVGAQIASALALVALAALLASSQRRFVSDSHFEPSPVALMRLAPSFGASARQRYPPAKAEALHRTVLQRLSQLPGVVASCLFTANGPLLDGRPVTVSRPEVAGAPAIEAGWHAISPGFFSVLGIPLRQGRDFDPRDIRDAPRVAIVSERLAQLLWPGRDALGSTLTVNGEAPARVVGIVADVTARAAGQPVTPHVYRPFGQEGGLDARYAVRVQGDPAAALPALVRAVTDVDSEVSVRDTSSMEEALAGEELRNVRMTAAIATYGALLSVLLSAIGIYGTVAFSVARRTREIGVRIAVGAGPRDVVALILREEMRTVLAGMLAGLALAWGGSRLVRHLLYGSAPEDLIPYAVAAVVVAAAAVLACWLPSRRAAALDPMTALRVD